MGRNIHCRAEERIQIITLRGEGKSQREIAKIIGRSRKMVENALKPKNNKETRGPKRKTTSRIDRQIVRVSKIDPFKSSINIKNELNLPVSARTIRRRLKEI